MSLNNIPNKNYINKCTFFKGLLQHKTFRPNIKVQYSCSQLRSSHSHHVCIMATEN